MCVCVCVCVVAKKQVFPVWVEIKKVSKSLFWHVFSNYSFSVFAKLKSVSHPPLHIGFQWGSLASGKEPACQCRDVRDRGLVLGSGRSPEGTHGNPLQYSCLENPMDRGAWWVRVHGGHTESDTPEAMHVAPTCAIWKVKVELQFRCFCFCW